jgi:hypothetical protein
MSSSSLLRKSHIALDEHSFASFAELKDLVKDKGIPSYRPYWDLFSIMFTMGPGQAVVRKRQS